MSLSRINAENVARHLVYAGTMMDENPEVAYEHAQAAYRHAARIDIVREALGLAAYVTGRYGEALRELRTYRRMTDDYTHVAIEADSERGLGRPEKALAFIAEIPMKKLDRDAQVELALVTSGARADAGDSEAGLAVLEKINPESLEEELRARFELIRADRLEELERSEEAAEVRQQWEPIFTAEGEVDLYEDEDEDSFESEDAESDLDPENDDESLDSSEDIESDGDEDSAEVAGDSEDSDDDFDSEATYSDDDFDSEATYSDEVLDDDEYDEDSDADFVSEDSDADEEDFFDAAAEDEDDELESGFESEPEFDADEDEVLDDVDVDPALDSTESADER